MKKVGFLIFCLFAMCSMAGKAQDVVADSTGYIVKVGGMAPDFTVKLTDGKSITLSAEKSSSGWMRSRSRAARSFRSWPRGSWRRRAPYGPS